MAEVANEMVVVSAMVAKKVSAIISTRAKDREIILAANSKLVRLAEQANYSEIEITLQSEPRLDRIIFKISDANLPKGTFVGMEITATLSWARQLGL